MIRTNRPTAHLVAILATTMLVAGCADGISKDATDPLGLGPEQTLPPEARRIVAEAKARANVPMIDGTAPEVFEATDMAVWDGKPTFGDVWISVPGALQPERVEIRVEETGKVIRASMLVDDAPASPDAPIRLSSGAARALGVGPLQEVRITVTALRKTPVHEEASLQLPARDTPPAAHQPPLIADMIGPGATPAIQSAFAPAIDPGPVEKGFIEVAQAYDESEARLVVEGLAAQAIPVEMQEDFLRGENVYRVFASTQTDAQTLFSALEQVRYANGAEGSDSGTLIAELPNFLNEEVDRTPDWVELGVYSSRNEAMSVVQKLARTQVPTEVCDQRRGLLTTFRVFAGPTSSDHHLIDPVLRQRLSDAFCMGVAATEAALPLSDPMPVVAPALEEAPEAISRLPERPNIPEGAVRIRVGEATGDLNIHVPNPYSEPVLIPVQNLVVSVPKDASPQQVEAIRRALSAIE